LFGFFDVDWVGDVDKTKSTFGFVFLLGGGVVSWGNKKQECVALSICGSIPSNSRRYIVQRIAK